MPLSYDNTILDHQAEYFFYIAGAPSFWFSINSSYDHEFHLSRRLGMIPYDYECIMVAAKLAEYNKTLGFIIKLTNLNAYLTGHRFCTSNGAVSFEVATSKMDYNAFINGTKPTKSRVRCHFLRIGILSDHSPRRMEMQKYSDGRMIVTPPRLNGLRITQQSFRYCMEQYKWHYLLEKKKDDGHDDGHEDNNDESGDDNNEKDDDDAGEKNVNNAPVLVTPRDNSLNNIARTKMASLYPHLSQALGVGEDGFDPMNPSVRKKMCSLLRELNALLDI